MDQIWLRHVQKLTFRDPAPYLIRLREIEHQVATSALPEKAKALRTHGLRKDLERRQAALFCQGMKERTGHRVFLADEESQDYDFIAMWVDGDTRHFSPVQLKEVVPPSINPNATLESVLLALDRYPTSADHLTVAIHLNQGLHFEPNALQVPPLQIAALWVFGATAPDQSEWALWGNFTEPNPYGTRFKYPTEA